MPPEVHVTREEFDQLKKGLVETQDMVRDLHDALMVPQPGHEKALLHRAAEAAGEIERGKWLGRMLLWGVGFLAALGISVKLGIRPEDLP